MKAWSPSSLIKLLVIRVACFALLLPTFSSAQTVWDGGAGTNAWGTGGNWSPGFTPGAGTNVLFDNSQVATLPTTITLGTVDRSANSLTFDTDDALSLIDSGSHTLTLTSGSIIRTGGSSGSQGLAFDNLALGANGVFNIDGGGDFTIASIIANGGGARSVNKTGAGTLVLSGANTFSNGLTVSAGTVGFSANAAAGSGTLTLAGGTIYASGGARTLTNAVTVSNNFSVGGANNLTLSGAMNLGAATRTITTSNTGLTTFAGVVSGSAGIDKAGSGTLVLAGPNANTFTGNVTASGGTLRIYNDNNLGNTANDLALNGGTLETAAGLTLNAGRVVTVTANGGTLDVNTGTTLTLGTAGQLAGSGTLSKADAGTLSITAANTGYTGNTVLNGGVTRLAGYDGLGSGTASTLTINNGAELEADWGNGTTNYQGNIVINDGIIRHTDTNGNKAGFQNSTGTVTSLTINGNAQIIDQDGAASGGFVSMDGIVNLNTGAHLTANAVNATDEVRFGGGLDITLAAGSTLTTAGAGMVSLGSGSARTIIAEGTSASQATLALGATTNFANPGSNFQIDGSGTGGLRVEGTKAKVDALMTDARLAATTGSGGTLTVAYTDNGSRTLGTAANLSAASGVALGLASNGGTFTLGTAGGPTGDLANWGGLVVGPATTATFADSYVFNATADLTLLGGTLKLNGTTQTFDTLTVSVTSTIDFSGGISTLNLSNLVIGAGVTLNIINWVNAADFFYTANWAGATYDASGSPMNRVVFNSPTYTGSDTKWLSYGLHQITPVPEPSTYGALLMAAATSLVAWRRRRVSRPTA